MPSELRSYAGILLRRRRGLVDPSAMPRLVRAVTAARIDLAWVNTYRRALQLPDGPLLPPLALQLAAAPLHLSLVADARFPFPALGLVHVAQSVRLLAPVTAGQWLELRAFTSEAQVARKGLTFGLVTEVLSEGRLVWRGETTALAMSRAARGDEAPAPAAPSPAPEQGAPFQEVTVLHAAESLGRRYAAIAGDRNPIHQHALLARPFGFKRAIVHGTWTLAAALVAAGLGEPGACTLEAKFIRPVFLPSEVVIWQRDDGAARELKVTSRDGQTTHLTARLTST